jgi:hypothetical protein
MSKIGKYEALEQLIDDAWHTAQRLDFKDGQTPSRNGET